MIKRTREQWLALFRAHRASGLSAQAFCKEHSLCPKYFSLRRRQLEGEQGRAISSKRAFVKALPSADEASRSQATIVLRGAFGELSFPANISPKWLATFVQSLV